ncbi:hypothetical protein PoMZ_13270 [Pyricularia oryzae]|uniref:Uncharacterized protein n=1 Tax=Pyricularia oryzae TaxID=318829 RepID=A0A4P7NUQ5_PYROR|nr:hypothetical protein PoMZ_13270 [Pyricularia oryzae]
MDESAGRLAKALFTSSADLRYPSRAKLYRDVHNPREGPIRFGNIAQVWKRFDAGSKTQMSSARYLEFHVGVRSDASSDIFLEMMPTGD